MRRTALPISIFPEVNRFSPAFNFRFRSPAVIWRTQLDCLTHFLLNPYSGEGVYCVSLLRHCLVFWAGFLALRARLPAPFFFFRSVFDSSRFTIFFRRLFTFISVEGNVSPPHPVLLFALDALSSPPAISFD